MKQRVYFVQREIENSYGEIIDSYDLLIADDFDYALDYAKKKIAEFPLEPGENITIWRTVEIDGEVDYQDAELVWESPD